jgi:hypothetical protein
VINFSCPSCGKAYQLPQSAAGKTVPCNQCRTAMEIPSSTAVAPKRGEKRSKKSPANVSLPAGSANIPVTQVHANKKKYVIWTLLALGGLMLLGIGFVGGRSRSVEVVDRTGAGSLTGGDSSDSNNTPESDPQIPPVVDTLPETDPAADKATKIAAALKEGDWEAVLKLDPGNSQAQQMQRDAKIADLLAMGKWQDVLALDANNSQAKQMKAVAEKAKKIADLLAMGKWQDVLALDSNNSQAKQMQRDATITDLLAMGKWQDVLALDPNNKEAKEMKVAAETAATVIAPNRQDKDELEEIKKQIKDKHDDINALPALYYIDFAVAKNEPPDPEIIRFKTGEKRPGADDWDVRIEDLIPDKIWEMTVKHKGMDYIIARLRYIADEGILRFYKAPIGGVHGLTGELMKEIDHLKYADLLAYSQLIKIHEGTYISAGISTAHLFGKKRSVPKIAHLPQPYDPIKILE